jgi:outer membrane protein
MKVPLAAVLLLATQPLWAAGIAVTQTWRAATAHDPAYAAALARRDAGRTHNAQSRALWLPSLIATGSAGQSTVENRTHGAFFSAPGFGSTGGVDFRTEVNGARATRWSFVAEQPLLDGARRADSRAQKYSADIAEAQFRGVEQDLMVRSAQAYFAVLDARAQLQALRQLRAAAERIRGQAQARYEAGDIPATDMREAQAGADATGVQELEAGSALVLSEAAFTDLSGLEPGDLAALPDAATDELPPPEPLETWLARAAANSPLLASQQLATASATAQLSRFSALSAPRVSLVAQFGHESLQGSGDFGATDITGRQASIALQASIPLYTGGGRSAQHREARAQLRQAEAELGGADQQIKQQTRAVWLALTSAAARIRALQQLRGSIASRREATRLGAELGDRTALELLNAEADYQRCAADLQHARSQWFLAELQLRSVAGVLNAADLERIDQRLGVARSP